MDRAMYQFFTFLMTFPWNPQETELLFREMFHQFQQQALSLNDFIYLHTLEKAYSDSRYGPNLLGTGTGSPGSLKSVITPHSSQSLIRFFLYSNETNTEIGKELSLNDVDAVRLAGIRSDSPLKILIHGFQSSYSSAFPQQLKNAYLKSNGSYNVICVDWGALSGMTGALSPLLYPFVVENVPFVGEKVAELIQFLKSHGMVSDLGLVHIIGFSLGAHAAGIAGSIVRSKSLRKIGRITGLDPAGPKYTTSQPFTRRLDPTDANFVDVIHTNSVKLGYPGQLGHVDFYPNGGKQQPNCDPNQRVANIQGISNIKHIFANSCSHSKAPQYFIKSITTKQEACRCSSWIEYQMRCRFNCKEKTVFGEHVPLRSFCHVGFPNPGKVSTASRIARCVAGRMPRN